MRPSFGRIVSRAVWSIAEAAEPSALPGSAALRPPLAQKEEDVLDLDLALLVDHVHPRSRRIHLGRVRPELHLGVNSQQRLLVISDRLDYIDAAGDDAVGKLDQ